MGCGASRDSQRVAGTEEPLAITAPGDDGAKATGTPASAWDTERKNASEEGEQEERMDGDQDGEREADELEDLYEKLKKEDGRGVRGGGVEAEDVASALQEYNPNFNLTESETWQQIVVRRKEEEGAEARTIEQEDFRAVAQELARAEASKFFESLSLPSLFVDVLKHRRSTDALGSLQKASRARRKQAVAGLLRDIAPQLEEKIVTCLEGREGYAAQEEARGTSKYSVFELASSDLFHHGLAGLIGMPEADVLAAMEREHTAWPDSQEAFEAFNGKLRVSTPAGEWAKVLLPDGQVNNMDYEGRGAMCADFMQHPRTREAQLQKCEVVALRLYTGPMFTKYNGKLRRAIQLLQANRTPPKHQHTSLQDLLRLGRELLGRSYVTTIHALNSGLIKLARVTVLPADHLVYRGIAGLREPELLSVKDKFGCRGGVEGGFLSTSTERAQALTYMQVHKGLPRLLELRLGIINRGADVSFLSYFQAEQEVLLPPLSCLEVCEAAKYELTEKGWVRVLPVVLNVNLKGQTIEELEAVRKTLYAQLSNTALEQVYALLALRNPSSSSSSSSSQPSADALSSEHALSLLQDVRAQCVAAVSARMGAEDRVLNQDVVFAQANDELFSLRPWVAGVVRVLEVGVDVQVLRQLSLRDFCAKVQAQTDWGRATAVAAAACARLGLFGSSVEEADEEGNTPLMARAGRGEVLQVRVLLEAGAVVDALNMAGKTPLMAASVSGHAEVVKGLVERKANVNARDSQLQTPLMCASRGGHLAVAELLLSGGAGLNAKDREKKTAYALAKEHGHAELAAMLEARGAETSVVGAEQDDKDRQIELQQSQIKAARAAMERVSQELASSQTVNQDLARQVQAVRDRLAQIEARERELERLLEERTESAAWQRAEEAMARAARLEEENARLRASLRGAEQESERSKARLEAEQEALARGLRAVEEELEQASAEGESARARLEHAQTERAAVETRAEELAAQLRAHAEEAQELRLAAARRAEEAAQMQTRLSASETGKEELAAALEEARVQVEEGEQREAALRQNHAAVRKLLVERESRNSEKQLTTALATVSRLERELADVQARFRAKEEESDANRVHAVKLAGLVCRDLSRS